MSNFIFYTLHFDGSHTNQFQNSGAGCIIRDNAGQFVVAASYNLGEINPESMIVAIVEAIALCNGLKLAERRKIKLHHIKGDNKEVIDHIRGQASRVPKSGSLSKIIEEIKVVLNAQNIEPFKVELISREGNQVADSLAYEGSKLWSESKIYEREEDLPNKTAELVRQEKSLTGGISGGRDGGGGGGGSGGEGGNNNAGSSSNSSMAETIGMAGAAVAGVAMVAWGVSKLFFDHKFHVLHVDGLDSNQREKAAAGCIIRDKHGELVSAGAYNLDHCYPPCHIGIAEATALKKGLELAQELKIKLDLIKVDNERGV